MEGLNLNSPGMAMKFMKPRQNKWYSFVKLSLITIVVSIGASFLCYHWFGKEIDFFNIICGLFTIVGLGIAIFQIVALRSEQEIRDETRLQVNTANFKREYRNVLVEAIEIIKELEALVSNTDFNETTFQGFLAKIDQILEKFHNIANQQVVLQGGTIVDCQKCLTLLNELSKDFREIMDTNTYQTFRKNYYIGKVKDLVIEGRKCVAEISK